MVKNEHSVDYVLKLKALLHDPIHKAWLFSRERRESLSFEHEDEIGRNLNFHEKVAEDLFRFLIKDSLKDEKIKIADRIASAFSRIIVEGSSQVFFESAKFIDPFTGKCQDKIGAPEDHDSVVEVFRKLGQLSFPTQQELAKFTFLFLWRFLPDIFPWVETHPADTRSPNHSIYDHLVQCSCIATCLDEENKPAFLLFTISPVQSFITIARKTSDLWAGSYLLSYFIYKAIEVIMENFGPDHIIFPNLRKQPLVDLWLYERYFKDLPIDKVGALNFENWKKSVKSDDRLLIANFPNRFLAIVPYERAKDIAKCCEYAIRESVEELLKKATDEIKNDENTKKAMKDHLFKYLRTYWVVLPFYKEDHKVRSILSEYEKFIGKNDLYNVVKTIIDNPYYRSLEENVGSAYSLFVDLVEKFMASRKAIRDFQVVEVVKDRIERCHLCGEYEVLNIVWKNFGKYVGEGEKLCGMCLFKRLLPELIKNKFGFEVRFPSTSEMATVKYKVNLADKSLEEVRKFIEKYNLPKTASVPKLKDNPLYEIDGQWLMESSYRKEYLEKEYGVKDVSEKELEEIKKFLKEEGIKPPVYYAILSVDGDNMGKWLRGEYLPEIELLLHREVSEKLSKNERLRVLLKRRHPISPSFHNLFSRRLSEFALEIVKSIVEENYYGKLIYAGGDDVLAFLPVEEALDCAFELNEAFRELLGEKASVSAGIVFVHHKYPLSLALKEVKDAQKRAKYVYGRSAVCIKYISGSGQVRETGFQWKKKTFFDELVEKFSKKELSSKFAYDLLQVVMSLQGREEKIDDRAFSLVEREVKRLYRHKISKVDKDFEKKLTEAITDYKNNILSLANMLVIARFVSKKGDRDEGN